MEKIFQQSPELLRRKLLAATGAALVGLTASKAVADITTDTGSELVGFGAGKKVSDLLLSTAGNGESLVKLKRTETGGAERSVLEKVSDEVSVKDFGAVGDGVTDDTTAVQNALNSGMLKIKGVSGETYKIASELTIPANVTFDMNNSTLIADINLAGTDNVVKLDQLNVTIKNGTIDGNKANLVNGFASGIYGCCVLVFTGGSGARLINMKMHDSITNGTSIVANAVDNIQYIDVNSYDNAFTGMGVELLSNAGGEPSNIRFLNCRTSNNNIGGGFRIQAADGCYLENCVSEAEQKEGLVIGVGEAKGVCRVKIINSHFNTAQVGVNGAYVSGVVGGAGTYAGQREICEVEMINTRITGAGGATGLLLEEAAKLSGSNIVTDNFSDGFKAQTQAKVFVDGFSSMNNGSRAFVVSTAIYLNHPVAEMWGATSDAFFLDANAAGSVILNADLGAATGETGQDAIGISGTPAGIRFEIDKFTGTRWTFAGVSGAVLNTWEVNDLGTKNLMTLIDGITAPATVAGEAKIYVDVSDGNLKVKFGDGFVATIAVDA